VTTSEGEDFAKHVGAMFSETSSLKDQKVSDVFNKIIEEYVKMREVRQRSESEAHLREAREDKLRSHSASEANLPISPDSPLLEKPPKTNSSACPCCSIQ